VLLVLEGVAPDLPRQAYIGASRARSSLAVAFDEHAHRAGNVAAWSTGT
jgi:hypothetical protein